VTLKNRIRKRFPSSSRDAIDIYETVKSRRRAGNGDAALEFGVELDDGDDDQEVNVDYNLAKNILERFWNQAKAV